MEGYVEFTWVQFMEFKKLYELAVELGYRQFTYNKEEYLTGYAKYVVEYLEDKYKETTAQK